MGYSERYGCPIADRDFQKFNSDENEARSAAKGASALLTLENKKRKYVAWSREGGSDAGGRAGGRSVGKESGEAGGEADGQRGGQARRVVAQAGRGMPLSGGVAARTIGRRCRDHEVPHRLCGPVRHVCGGRIRGVRALLLCRSAG